MRLDHLVITSGGHHVQCMVVVLSCERYRQIRTGVVSYRSQADRQGLVGGINVDDEIPDDERYTHTQFRYRNRLRKSWDIGQYFFPRPGDGW